MNSRQGRRLPYFFVIINYMELMISKEDYKELKEYWDYQRKIEYNREILRDQLENVHEDEPEADVDHMFAEIWNHVDPIDYDDPPRGWIPKNAKFRVEGEMQGRMPR